MNPELRRRTPTLRAARVILAKDLRIELRTLQSLSAMLLFSLTTFVLFRYGLDRTSLEGSLASGVLLMTILFAAVLGIGRLFVAEREQGGFDAFALAPIDGSALFYAKVTAQLIYLAILEAFALPVFAVLFLSDWSGLGALTAVLALLNLGLALIGTIVSVMATNSRARDLLTPLLLLPLLVPLMISAASAAAPLLDADGPSFAEFPKWLALLGLYDLIFGLIGWAVFDYLIED